MCIIYAIVDLHDQLSIIDSNKVDFTGDESSQKVMNHWNVSVIHFNYKPSKLDT